MVKTIIYKKDIEDLCYQYLNGNNGDASKTLKKLEKDKKLLISFMRHFDTDEDFRKYFNIDKKLISRTVIINGDINISSILGKFIIKQYKKRSYAASFIVSIVSFMVFMQDSIDSFPISELKLTSLIEFVGNLSIHLIKSVHNFISDISVILS